MKVKYTMADRARSIGKRDLHAKFVKYKIIKKYHSHLWDDCVLFFNFTTNKPANSFIPAHCTNKKVTQASNPDQIGAIRPLLHDHSGKKVFYWLLLPL